jgi:hypothetical protein
MMFVTVIAVKVVVSWKIDSETVDLVALSVIFTAGSVSLDAPVSPPGPPFD